MPTFLLILFLLIFSPCYSRAESANGKQAEELTPSLAIDYHYPSNVPVRVVRIGHGLINAEIRRLHPDDYDFRIYGGPVYAPDNPPYPNSEVALTVEASSTPFILAVLAHSSVKWHIDNKAGTQLKAVIVGGHDYGEVSGLDDAIPVLHTKFINDRRSRPYDEPTNTYPDEKIISALEAITGNEVVSFESMTDGSLLTLSAEWLQPQYDKNTKLYVLTTYHGFNPETEEPYQQDIRDEWGTASPSSDTVTINIQPGKDPVVLALDANDLMKWTIVNPSNRTVSAIILSGGHDQQVEGIKPETRLFHRNYRLNMNDVSTNYDMNNPQYKDIVEAVSSASGINSMHFAEYIKTVTGLPVASVQNANYTDQFEVGDHLPVSLPDRLKPIGDFKPIQNAEIHAIGTFNGRALEYGPVSDYITDLYLEKTAKPIILLLSSMRTTYWKIHNPYKVRVVAIIYGGVPVQEFAGINTSIPIYYQGQIWQAYEDPIQLKTASKALFGKEPDSLQYEYQQFKYHVPPVK